MGLQELADYLTATMRSPVSRPSVKRTACIGEIRTMKFSGTSEEGLEYRFTPHIGLFSDVRFNLVDGPKNNYLSTRFGLRYAF
jgi:hypothetical protein